MPLTAFSFSGYETGAQLAEETRNARRTVSKGIVFTCICSAIIGFIYLLALLFAIPNVNSFMDANNSDNATTNLAVSIFQSVLPHPCAVALAILLIINVYFAGISSITVTSRIRFAMARDGVFPCSEILRWIFEPTKTPLLVSSTAFNAFIGIATLVPLLRIDLILTVILSNQLELAKIT